MNDSKLWPRSTTHAHTNINDRHTNTATHHKNKTRTSRSMEEGFGGVVRARVEDASLAGSTGHGFRAARTGQPKTCRLERTEEREGRTCGRAGST